MQRIWTLAGTTELASQRLVHVELGGYGTAAVEVQVVLAAQLALLAEGRLTGRALLLEVTTGCESKTYQHMAGKKNHSLLLCLLYTLMCKLKIDKTETIS